MAGQIRVSPETLQTRANEYGKASNDVNTILSNLSNLQEQLRSEWEGAAFQGFDAQFNELKPKVTQFALPNFYSRSILSLPRLLRLCNSTMRHCLATSDLTVNT